MTAPTLHTARLILRPPEMADFAPYAAFLATARARHMGGPHGPATAWEWFCNDSAQWPLLNLGGLIVTRSSRAIGQVALCHGPQFPEPQLGWFLFDAADQGRGYAFEAAAALRDWAFGPRGLASVVSYIDPANLPSVRLAQRLGGRLDPAAVAPDGLTCATWRIDRPAQVAA